MGSNCSSNLATFRFSVIFVESNHRAIHSGSYVNMHVFVCDVITWAKNGCRSQSWSESSSSWSSAQFKWFYFHLVRLLIYSLSLSVSTSVVFVWYFFWFLFLLCAILIWFSSLSKQKFSVPQVRNKFVETYKVGAIYWPTVQTVFIIVDVYWLRSV